MNWVPTAVTAVTTVVAAVVASSGFWAYMQKKDTSKTAMTRLLLGLAYDKIAQLGLSYIDRGWISRDEYEDFRKYLYEPYKDFGGNGVAEQIMHQVEMLPLRTSRDLAYSKIVEAKLEAEKGTGHHVAA